MKNSCDEMDKRKQIKKQFRNTMDNLKLTAREIENVSQFPCSIIYSYTAESSNRYIPYEAYAEILQALKKAAEIKATNIEKKDPAKWPILDSKRIQYREAQKKEREKYEATAEKTINDFTFELISSHPSALFKAAEEELYKMHDKNCCSLFLLFDNFDAINISYNTWKFLMIYTALNKWGRSKVKETLVYTNAPLYKIYFKTIDLSKRFSIDLHHRDNNFRDKHMATIVKAGCTSGETVTNRNRCEQKSQCKDFLWKHLEQKLKSLEIKKLIIFAYRMRHMVSMCDEDWLLAYCFELLEIDPDEQEKQLHAAREMLDSEDYSRLKESEVKSYLAQIL